MLTLANSNTAPQIVDKSVKPIWASEVLPYPIAVTKSRFKEENGEIFSKLQFRQRQHSNDN